MARNYGLVSKNAEEKIPLEGVKVNVEITGYTAQVVASMEYKNNEENPIEAIYIFPLDEQAAVCGFQATVDGRTIVAEIQEREKARDEYDDAISSGHSAFLLEESDESSDIFQISVGNLPPQKSATVQLTFVTELETDDVGSVIFVLPTVLNPRYTPSGVQPSISNQIPTSTVAEPYSFEFKLTVTSGSPIQKIHSPSSTLKVEISPQDECSARVILTEPHKFSRDVEVHVVNEQPFTPHALLEKGFQDAVPLPEKQATDAETDTDIADGFLRNPVVMVNFVPHFATKEMTCGEFIFVVDRSGSMDGERIESAARTLQLFLKSLPDGCLFNIIGFGSSYQSLFPKSEAYTDKTLKSACQHAKNLTADLGGTEILGPLQWVFSQPLVEGSPRQVFVLTDGSVGNAAQVISLVSSNADKARVFTFGIGDGASTELVKGVARAGNGTAEFVRGEEKLQAKVIKTLKRALQPCLTGLKLTWAVSSKNWTAVDVQKTLPPLFVGDRMIVYGVLKRCPIATTGSESTVKGKAVIEATLHESNQFRKVQEQVEFEINAGSADVKKQTDTHSSPSLSLVLHRLAAKRFISTRQQSSPVTEQVKQGIIKVSEAASVASKFTSFIAVDQDSKEPVGGAMKKRIVPSTVAYPPMHKSVFSLASRRARRKLTKGADLPLIPPGAAPQRSQMLSSLNCSLNFRKKNLKCSKMGYMPRKGPEPGILARASKKTADRLMRLVDLQKACGSWEFTDDLADCLQTSKDVLLKAQPAVLAKESRGEVWATALVLVWLAGKLPERKDEWEMIGNKGERWLKSSLPAGIDYGQLMGAAYQALNI